jgi:hypothetical protein
MLSAEQLSLKNVGIVISFAFKLELHFFLLKLNHNFFTQKAGLDAPPYENESIKNPRTIFFNRNLFLCD